MVSQLIDKINQLYDIHSHHIKSPLLAINTGSVSTTLSAVTNSLFQESTKGQYTIIFHQELISITTFPVGVQVSVNIILLAEISTNEKFALCIANTQPNTIAHNMNANNFFIIGLD